MLLRPLPLLARPTPFRFPAGVRPLLLVFGFSLPFLSPFGRTVVKYDTSPSPSSSPSSASAGNAKTPLTTDGRTLNPAAVRQISLGSLLGLGAGLMLSAFSRSLTLLLGLGIVVWQYAARKGYHILPADRVQRYVQGVDLRSAVHDNVAFKISFGLLFALASFGEF